MTAGIACALGMASKESMVVVPISGTAVTGEKPPEQQIKELLAFFDLSVASGTLTGAGGGTGVVSSSQFTKFGNLDTHHSQEEPGF